MGVRTPTFFKYDSRGLLKYVKNCFKKGVSHIYKSLEGVVPKILLSQPLDPSTTRVLGKPLVKCCLLTCYPVLT